MDTTGTAAGRPALPSRSRTRASVVAGLGLVERLATLAAAWSFAGSSLATQLGAGAAVALVFATRTFAQVAFVSRTQAELLDRVIVSLLRGDVLKGTVLPDQDAHAELAQALRYVSEHLVRERPLLVADGLASAIIASFIAWHEPPKLVLGAVAVLLLALCILAWSRASLRRSIDREWIVERQAFDAMVDALEGRLEIVATGRSDAFVERARVRVKAWGDAGVRRAAAAVLSGRLPLFGLAGLVIGLALVADRMGVLPLLRMSELAVFASAIPAFSGVAQGIQAKTRADRWLTTVGSIINDASRPRPAVRSVQTRRPKSISLDGVSFRYAVTGREASNEDGRALSHVSFAWNAEGILALTGRNGSGKSTLFRLLLGLAAPSAGRICLDGDDLAHIDADSWRAHLAYLPQRPYLPPRSTIGEAIRLLVPTASDDGIFAALDRVGALPSLQRGSRDPLRTYVGELSIGQRQRVALARMLCMDPGWLVLLDEPDANLDRAGIALVGDVIRELAGTRAVIVAAHSSELLESADRILVLENGRLVHDQVGNSMGHAAPGT